MKNCSWRKSLIMAAMVGICLMSGCGKENSTYERRELSLAALENLSISTREGDVIFHVTDEAPYAELVTHSSGIHVESNVDLKISQSETSTQISMMREETFGMGEFNIQLDLYMPADAIKSLEAKIKGSLKCKDFVFDKVATKLYKGYIEIGDVKSKRMELAVSGGELQVYGCDADSVALDLQAGNISVEFLNEKTQLACTVFGGLLEAEGNFSKAHLKCDGGEISLNSGTVPYIMSCQCISGKTRVRLPQTESGFKLDYTIGEGRFHTDFERISEEEKSGTFIIGKGDGAFAYEIREGEVSLEKR